MELKQIRKQLVGKYLSCLDTAQTGTDMNSTSLIQGIVRMKGIFYRILTEEGNACLRKEDLQCLAEGHSVVYYIDNRDDIELALESGLFPPEYEINVQVYKVRDEDDTDLKELFERCIEEA